MRVAVLTTSFPRGEDDPSGHFVLASARALVRGGDDVHVVAPGGSVLDAPRATRDGLMLHRAGGGALFTWPGAGARIREAPWRAASGASFVAGARLRLRRLAPVDRIVAHWVVPCAFPIALGVEGALDVVAHGADVRLLLQSPRLVREAVIDVLLARGARFSFAAEVLLRSLEAGLSPGIARALSMRARVEAPAIDLPDVAAAARETRIAQKLEEGERLVVAAARLVSSKRIELAIDAMAKLERARLVVVGDGPERATLERRAASSRARVAFVGMLPRARALAFVAAADALVHPSALEAAPTIVREARALGVPVVACDAGDVAAWSTSDRGIAIAEATPDALASALRAAFASRA